MTISRRKTAQPEPTSQADTNPEENQNPESVLETLQEEETNNLTTEALETSELPSTEGEKTEDYKVYLGEEDKRLMKKFNKHIINKLGLKTTRSFRV